MEHSLVDIGWIVAATGLVLFMQAGFLCLESGFTRSKNNINVAAKNLADFGISGLVFLFLGFGLMFGDSWKGIFGATDFLFGHQHESTWKMAVFLFQLAFCSTAVTIVSGAVAERFKFGAYLIVSGFVVSLLYPLFGHWAWGGLITGDRGWLAGMGFVDFAGSSVVHSLGGWVGLAAVLVVGPRRGRFDEHGKPREIHGSNMPLSMLGAMILCIGWIGFNGGSTLALNEAVPMIVANTILAGLGGLGAAGLVEWLRRGYFDAKSTTNGLIAGLVAVTANCHAVTLMEATLIGATGAVIMVFIESLLVRRKIDDAVGAFPTHAGAGIWGTLAVALFGDPELLGTGLSFWPQLGVQSLGVFVCFVIGFGLSFPMICLVKRVVGLRVSEEEEINGLNVSEHQAPTEQIELLSAMHEQSCSRDFSVRVPVEPFTEIGQIARQYNHVLDSLQAASEQNNAIVRDIRDGVISMDNAGNITSFNPGAEKLFRLTQTDTALMSFDQLFESDGFSICSAARLLEDICSAPKGATLQTELLGRRKNGPEFRAHVTVSKDSRSGSQHITALVRDVTDQRAAEHALITSQQKFQSLVNSIDGIVWEFNRLTEQFTYVSDQSLRILGYRPEEWYAEEDFWSTRIHTKDRQRAVEWFAALGKEDRPPFLDYRMLHADGKIVWVRHSAGNYKSDAVSPLHRGVFLDITAQKNMEIRNRSLNSSLVEKSRQAGMAEVATSVLHNVGNVLNSVNIAADQISESVRSSRVTYLKEATGIMRNNLSDLGNFLTKDPEGQELPEFLIDLADNINEEHHKILGELGTLRDRISHIKEIVTMQQGYAKVVGVVEMISPPTLLDDAVRLNEADLQRDGIKVEKHYEDISPSLIDKYKTLQILVNLIRNAKHAINGSGVPEKKMVLKIDTARGKRVRFSVIDNGVGIPEKDLKRIFQHGFTTRKKGHGFGLHSAATAAAEMGGSLTAKSEGEGKGASFILELPVQTQEPVRHRTDAATLI